MVRKPLAPVSTLVAVLVKDRISGIGAASSARDSGRPVVLGTLACPIEPEAERMAFESALHANSTLLVTNVVHLPSYPTALMLAGPGAAILPHEEALEDVRATADRAAALGIPTEHLRVCSKRPVRAMLEVAGDRDAGMIVFGPDRTRIKPRRFERAAKRIRSDAGCLVWVTPDG